MNKVMKWVNFPNTQISIVSFQVILALMLFVSISDTKSYLYSIAPIPLSQIYYMDYHYKNDWRSILILGYLKINGMAV